MVLTFAVEVRHSVAQQAQRVQESLLLTKGKNASSRRNENASFLVCEVMAVPAMEI